MTFRLALLYSAALHMTLGVVRPLPGLAVQSFPNNFLEVTYEPVPAQAAAPSLPVPRAVSSVEPVAAAPERVPTGAIPARSPHPVSVPQPRPAARPIPIPPPAETSTRPSVKPMALSPAPASHLQEWEFAQLRHKEQVRRYLKAHLNYPGVLLTGSVRLRLVLLPDGKLQQVEVLESSDPRLVDAALQDARSAEPYPAFPGPLRRRQVTYDYLVRYEPE